MELFNTDEKLLTFNNQNGRFVPNQAPDIASQYERAFTQYKSQLRFSENSFKQNQQTYLDNSKKQGETLLRLGELSKSAGEAGKQILDKFAEIEEIREVDNYFFGGLDTPSQDTTQQIERETELLDEGEELANEGSRIASRAEQRSGNPEVGQTVQSTLTTGLPQAATGDRSRAMEAATLLPSWITSYLSSDATISINGTSIPIRAAIASNDPGVRMAAQRQAMQVFYQQANLGSISARNRVRYIVPTMRSTMASVGSTLTQQAIETARSETASTIDGTAYAAGRQAEPTTESLQAQYDGLTQTYFTSNTGLTQAQSNQRTTEQLLNGMVSNGDIDSINALASVRYSPTGGDGPGNTLEGRYPELFQQARSNAQRTNDANRRATQNSLNEGLYRDLAQATTPEQRAEVIRRYQGLGRDAGLWQWADAIGDKGQDLMTPGDTVVNAEVASNGIATGEITSVDQLDILRDTGLVTPDQYTNLVSELNARNSVDLPSDSALAGVVDSEIKAGQQDMSVALGMRNDQSGQLAYIRGTSVLTLGEYTIVSEGYERAGRRYANELIRQNPEITAAELQQRMQEWRRGMTSAQGTYPIQPMLDARRFSQSGTYQVPDDLKSYWRNLATSPRLLNTSVPSAESELPQSFQAGEGGAIDEDTRNSFIPARGDTIFDPALIVDYSDQWSRGTINPSLATAAQGLGMTPLALLNQQRATQGLPGLLPQQLRDNPYSNAMAMGLPENTARYLQTVGLNLSMEQLTQLSLNPNARSILNNPTSTDRQLRRAISELYPGSGDTQQTTQGTQQSSQQNRQGSTPYEPVLSLLRSGEGNYNSANRGSAGDTPGGVSNLSSMTYGQWKNLQDQGYFALGAYQFIPETLRLAANELGINDSTVMSPEMQDRLAIQLMTGTKRPRLAAYLNGTSNDVDAALDDLALEWASVANSSGRSAYAGVGNNAASISRGSARERLIQIRNTLNS